MRVRGRFSGAGPFHPAQALGEQGFNWSTASMELVLLVVVQLCTGCGYYVSASRPKVIWSDPSAVIYGTVLSSSQLNARADVAGTFQYSPAAGALLGTGKHVLSVTFTPSDLIRYSRVSRSVTLTVEKAPPMISWPAPAAIPFGTPLTNVQLNATASIAGSFSYVPASGTILNHGSQVLSTKFTPADSANYTAATATVELLVNPVSVSLSLKSGDSALVVGEGTKLVVSARYSDESTAEVTNSASFSALPEQVVRLDSRGEASCIRRGTVQISATFGSVNASTKLTCMQVLHQQPFSTLPDEFVGPFPSWHDVKSDFGAVGDGVADDTTAIQKGLDAVSVGHDASDRSVLWVPKGRYRITRGLMLANKEGVALIGEDPEETEIVWDGPAGGTMLFTSGMSRTRVLRLHFKGSGLADTGYNIFWDGKAPYYPAFEYVTDSIFSDLKYALRVGFAGPIMLDRVRFTNISEAGISLEDWNAGEVWIRDSHFQDCRAGITNRNGAGQFNVYNSTFVNSTKADMYIANTQFFSARGNTSIGSNAFLIADPAGNNGAQFVLQDNLIVDTATTPITVGNRGPLILIDNTVLLPQGSPLPVVKANDFGSITTDVMTLGNVFTTPSVLSGNVGRSISIDDRVEGRGEFAIELPSPAPFLKNSNRRIVEVPVTFSTAQLQQALNDSGSQAGSHTALHFTNGQHLINQTLVVPGSSDALLVGDGIHSSRLKWVGDAGKPMMVFENPARATLRDIGVNGSWRADGIDVQVNDVPGSRVLLSGIDTSGLVSGVVSDGLDQAIEVLRASMIA